MSDRNGIPASTLKERTSICLMPVHTRTFSLSGVYGHTPRHSRAPLSYTHVMAFHCTGTRLLFSWDHGIVDHSVCPSLAPRKRMQGECYQYHIPGEDTLRLLIDAHRLKTECVRAAEWGRGAEASMVLMVREGRDRKSVV